MPRYRGLLLDLFGTLIAFDPARLPEMVVGETRLRTTVVALEPLLCQWTPGVTPERFFDTLVSVSEELARARAWDHIELPSRERFRRALERVGCEEEQLAEAAVHLSRAHMRLVADATTVPAGHHALLEELRPKYRLGLVSNFDDTATAYDILLRHRLAGFLDPIIVSEALGLRKPHPALIRAGLTGLGLGPDEVLFVGDTFNEDIAGAHAAGVDAAWIDAKGRGVPDDGPRPRYVLRTLLDLRDVLTAG
jgi:HAD superfamily hydrolase (TIGR01549 family)